MTSSSYSNTGREDFDVFVSFRGETRNNFISHIREAFEREQINFFVDTKLERGEEIKPALLKMVETAKISLIVFSSDYAFSTFCLDETTKIMECRESKEQIVLPIFYKVDPSEIRKQNGRYGIALDDHESHLIEMEREHESRLKEMERVRGWKLALTNAANLTGWHIDEKSDEAKVVEEITDYISKLLKWKLNPSKGKELMSVELVGMTAEVNVMKVMDCLMSGKTLRIGIHGMGGVGKTTMVARINNDLLSCTKNEFQYIYWVTVSKETSIYKLQHDIAKLVRIDLSEEENPSKRARMLWNALLGKKKFLMILDDMWTSIELEEVGIPISPDAGKLLLTTRHYGVCKEMICEQFKVEPLTKPEAWDLFIRKRGQIHDDPELRKIVECVVQECACLPLAIVVIAKCTMKFKEIYQWRNILRELKRPSDEQTIPMEERVFEILKVSYDRLPKDKYRQCLLYCALYPEDSEIPREFLIRYWIGEGLMDELDSRKEDLDAGNSIIEELIDASLLERVYLWDEKDVKMHDVIRDMTLTITREKFMVKAGLQLKEFPNLGKWSVDLERISIMKNPGLKRCLFNSAPNCPKLRTLLMQQNESLKELPDFFFDKMQNLLVLDMFGLWSLRLLPESISKLKGLRVLILRSCSSLEYIPSLAALEDLRHLDLSCTMIKVLPEGMEKLVNLRMLFIMDAKMLGGLFPSAVLEKLSHLRSFCLEGTNATVEPNALMCLEELETMSVIFENSGALNSYLKSRHWNRLDSYVIFTKPGFGFMELSFDNDVPAPDEKTMYLWNDGETDIEFPYNVANLELWDWDVPFDSSLKNGNFANLSKLILRKCKAIYLISTIFAQELLPTIRELVVVNCKLMEEIIATEDFNESDGEHYPDIVLPNFLTLHLSDLPVLKSIYRGMIVCPFLKTFHIHNCEKLDRLPFLVLQDDNEGLRMMLPRLRYITGSALWWDSLEWDGHPRAKDVLQRFFIYPRSSHWFYSDSEYERGSALESQIEEDLEIEEEDMKMMERLFPSML